MHQHFYVIRLGFSTTAMFWHDGMPLNPQTLGDDELFTQQELTNRSQFEQIYKLF